MNSRARISHATVLTSSYRSRLAAGVEVAADDVRYPRPSFVTALIILFALFLCAMAFADGDAEYDYYVVGSAADVDPQTRGLLVMQGGGTDVDQNYSRMGEFGGGGDFVVLRASGGDEYNAYIFDLCNCDSVETIVFAGRPAAYDNFVVQTIRNAEALFIAGGDQSNYVRYWKDTPVEDAIHAVAAKPAPIGGTSAGMAIMGQHVYAAMSENSLTAEHALANPFHPDLTLEWDFLRLRGLENVLTDQHLIERDRIGRTIAMMARLVHDGVTPVARALAADRETAVHVDPETGEVEVFAVADHETPYVYFMRTTAAADVCEAGKPLTIEQVEVVRSSPGDSFNLETWTAVGGTRYTFDVAEGALSSSLGPVYGPGVSSGPR